MNNNPRVVAIGASTGGLDAFRKLIENLPSDTGMAFVLLTHILRNSKSMLAEILAKSTTMQVIVATEGLKLLADHIYVLPADKMMEIKDGVLHLSPRPPTGANHAIDHFLFSLAADRVYSSIGIVLSGEGADGAEGLKILKEEGGGVTIAQEPASAIAKSMPVNAIEIDHIDHVLTPEDIARQLASMSWRDEHIKTTPLTVFWSGLNE